MIEIKELTEIQYNILSVMNQDWCYPFSHFENLTKKELSKEFKILREAGLVYFSNGLMNEDNEVCGSGYGINSSDKLYKLTGEWEEKNLPTWGEAMKGLK